MTCKPLCLCKSLQEESQVEKGKKSLPGSLTLALCKLNFFPTGTQVPPQATLVFEVLMVDVFNPKDDLIMEVKQAPEVCTRRTVTGDYIRYHYNGTFQDGTPFDSR